MRIANVSRYVAGAALILGGFLIGTVDDSEAPVAPVAGAVDAFGAESGESVLSLVANCFAAANPEPVPKSRGLRASRTVEIPGSREIIPFVIDFAKNGQQIVLNVGSREAGRMSFAGQPTVSDSGLIVPVNVSTVFTGKLDISAAKRTILWPQNHPEIRSACTGKWTKFGILWVKIDPQALLPDVLYVDGKTVVRWKNPPLFRAQWWLFRTWNFGLESFTIDENIGTFSVSGIPDAWLPTIVWK